MLVFYKPGVGLLGASIVLPPVAKRKRNKWLRSSEKRTRENRSECQTTPSNHRAEKRTLHF